jgi:flagellar L-ring protein precursor FlgH
MIRYRACLAGTLLLFAAGVEADEPVAVQPAQFVQPPPASGAAPFPGPVTIPAPMPVPGAPAYAGPAPYLGPLPVPGQGPFPLPRPPGPPLIRDYSWIYIDAAPPRKLQVHDIITVIVDEKSEVTSNNSYVRQKQGQFKAELRNFIRIDSSGNLNNAAQNQPSVEGNLQSRLNSRGQVNSREGVRYRIAATVVDVLPNGTIILEARKTIRTNTDVWEYSLTGRMRAQDVQANNTVLSENIADMNIVKSEKGRLRDSTKRGWMIWMYDLLGPF